MKKPNYVANAQNARPAKLTFDREPRRTELNFRRGDEAAAKCDCVALHIQHNELFPDVPEITLEQAQRFLSSELLPEAFPAMSAEEYMTIWNQLVNDPDFMSDE